jgi:hypothetical protein
MARTVAEIPAGPRISDFMSLGVLAKAFPAAAVAAALVQTGKASVRRPQAPIWSGASRRMRAWSASGGCPTAPT